MLAVEEFYRNFVVICNNTISKQFPDGDKMNAPFRYIGSELLLPEGIIGYDEV